MAAGKTGSFELSTVKSSVTYTYRVNWSETVDAETNSSTVTIASVEVKASAYFGGYTFYPDGLIKINGVEAIRSSSSSGLYRVRISNGNTYYTITDGSGNNMSASVIVPHNVDGTKTTSIEIAGNRFSGFLFTSNDAPAERKSWSFSGSQSIDLTNIASYTLSVSAGAGSTVTVERTYSGFAGTGVITDGARVYLNDKLKITFTPSSGYFISSSTVNGAQFTSGNTHTVTGNVSIVCSASQTKSTISATDANIGSASAIIVTRYNASYTHTITYSFDDLTGTIVTKSSNTALSWTVPTTFYEKIPNAKFGRCTLTCTTYNGDVSLGSTSTEITVTADAATCAPIINVNVAEGIPSFSTLTGGTSLILYKSTARCSILATPMNSASIVSRTVNGKIATGAYVDFANVADASFTFTATDSRGYTTTTVVTPTYVQYVPLTCNPVISRPSPTSNTINLSFDGNYYNGSLGNAQNTLVIRYRSRESSVPTFGEWVTIAPSNYTISGMSYRSRGNITLAGEFNYLTSYIVELEAYDGASGVKLSSAVRSVSVNRGIPVFDWGETDFRFNVPVYFGDKLLIDAIYPVGSIYMSAANVNPAVLFGGTWEQIQGKFLLASSSTHALGSTGGEEAHTLTVNEMPSHDHKINATTAAGYYAETVAFGNASSSSQKTTVAVDTSGGGAAHNNMPPYLTVNVWKRTD